MAAVKVPMTAAFVGTAVAKELSKMKMPTTSNDNRRSFTCNPDFWEDVKKFAREKYDGNVSLAIRVALKKVIYEESDAE